jgi:threonine/homoserine/homoserine lactone efflux protein
MQTSPDLWLFFVLVFGVIVLPGMDMAYVAGSALTAGLRGGAAAVAGIVAGGVLHVAVGATGIAALLVLWPAGFDALLLGGAAYMAWIGWSILRASGTAPSASLGAVPREGRVQSAIFGRAVLTCLLNPKAYAFMLAVFPAFIHSAQHSIAEQAVRLGAIVAITQVMVYGAVAVFVASARQWAGVSAHGQRWTARAVAAALIGGSVLTLVFGWRPLVL